jgi:wyosine [tRNA(Phe)-imidazoG37] synthetase (radical SAM superfamily)
MIGAVKKLRPDKVAVITNASLMGRGDVQKDLLAADVVIAKLDAASEEVFEKVNRPCRSIRFESTVQGIKDFRHVFKGKFFLQIMFVQENQADVRSISRLAREINPDAVQLNTPLRPSSAEPMSSEQMRRIKSYFEGMRTISVYEATLKKVTPISGVDTLVRRGKTQ